MKKVIETKYMMATTAIHKLGDISRDTPDLCVVSEEDEDNFYGNWVTGFGFISVRFPKTTTRNLTEDEIEKYHGMQFSIGDTPLPALNLKGEDFYKKVVISKEGTDKVYSGTLLGPIKKGRSIVLMRDDGYTFRSSEIKEVNDNKIQTRNSVYNIQYK